MNNPTEETVRKNLRILHEQARMVLHAADQVVSGSLRSLERSDEYQKLAMEQLSDIHETLDLVETVFPPERINFVYQRVWARIRWLNEATVQLTKEGAL